MIASTYVLISVLVFSGSVVLIVPVQTTSFLTTSYSVVSEVYSLERETLSAYDLPALLDKALLIAGISRYIFYYQSSRRDGRCNLL
jgi:hypothetical protein